MNLWSFFRAVIKYRVNGVKFQIYETKVQFQFWKHFAFINFSEYNPTFFF